MKEVTDELAGRANEARTEIARLQRRIDEIEAEAVRLKARIKDLGDRADAFDTAANVIAGRAGQ